MSLWANIILQYVSKEGTTAWINYFYTDLACVNDIASLSAIVGKNKS